MPHPTNPKDDPEYFKHHTMTTGMAVRGTSTYHGLGISQIPKGIRGVDAVLVIQDMVETGQGAIGTDGTRVDPRGMYMEPMTEEEMNAGPLPEWAIGYAKGELCLGAQLPTRDGRRCGNAHIVDRRVETINDKSQYVWTLLTDAGSTMEMTDGEVAEQFYPPVWVSDVDDVRHKFSPRPKRIDLSLFDR